MRRKRYVSVTCGLALALLLAGCGSGTPSTNTNPPTGLKKRVLLSNEQTGLVTIIDALKDQLSTKTASASGATKVVTAGGITAILGNTNPGQLSIFDNTKEQIVQAPLLADTPVDIAISADGKTAWAAERNAGFVQGIDTASGSISATVPVPSAARLALSPQGTKLLAFSDDPTQNAVFLIDTATVLTTANKNATKITNAALDQPFTAVFNNSETNVFVLNCGPECGGTAASVVQLDFSAAPSFNVPIPVAAATAGLLNGGNLFVAGTPQALPAGVTCTLAACGTLQVINTSTLTASAAKAVTDGRHLKMAFTSNGRLYVGASNCTPTPITGQNQVIGCLSIFDTSAQTVSFPPENSLRPNFNVTGLQPISGRSVIYVVQGFELDIFDITTNLPSTSITQIDIQGKAFDVALLDP